jgi:hypothetical protein
MKPRIPEYFGSAGESGLSLQSNQTNSWEIWILGGMQMSKLVRLLNRLKGHFAASPAPLLQTVKRIHSLAQLHESLPRNRAHANNRY